MWVQTVHAPNLHLYYFICRFVSLISQCASAHQRFEPSSRIFLIGEQPNPWDLLQPQDKMSRPFCTHFLVRSRITTGIDYTLFEVTTFKYQRVMATYSSSPFSPRRFKKRLGSSRYGVTIQSYTS